jgi:hypothetical protein
VENNYLVHEAMDRIRCSNRSARPEFAAIRAESIRKQKEFLAKRAP